jgi:hypothetical protein
MKNKFWSVVMIAGFSAVLGSALLVAEMPGQRATAEVPFAFHIQDRLMPGGNYDFQRMNSSGVLQIRNRETRETIVVLAPPSKSGKPGEPMLVFNGYGDSFYLSQVWFADETAGNALWKGHQEKSLSSSLKSTGVLAYVHLH